MISSLDQMVDKVLGLKKKRTIAVAWAQDPNTIGAVQESIKSGFAEAVMIGKREEIIKTCLKNEIDPGIFIILEADDEGKASEMAVRMARTGEADIVMKGLVGTDKLLRAVMDKESGIMRPGSVLSYVGAIEVPGYHKLLFITDPAVIPYPDLSQKIAMAHYSIEMAGRFGIENPRIALIGASEKPGNHFRYSSDYAEMCRMAREGVFGSCIMDGPLDIFLACDRESVVIKGINTPVGGEADVLLFPSLEACNPFYKGLMLFGRGELAGLIRGTEKPVVLMSRSESRKSKFYCIALSCLMANKN
jgi:phosphate butyryltransferase